MVLSALISSIVIGVGSFAWLFSQAGWMGAARWCIAFGIFWFVALWQKWRWASTAGVLMALTASILGLWFELTIGWIFSGMIFVLFAWDLTEFQVRLRALPAREDLRGRERRHLARVSFLALAGISLASLLMLWRGSFTLDWVLFTFVMVLAGLVQFFLGLRR